MRFDNLQDWLQWIESCHPSEIELGLERMGQVYKKLACGFENTKIVTVAGTNGKGTCVAVLERLLINQGLRVGCYTSPHFLRFNERIRVLGEDIDDFSLIAAFDKIDQLRGDVSLTYFEYGTLAALEIFSSSELDIIILEVGLGGRLDASNIVDADIAVVTNIDIDHVDWLGSDIEVIGREKSGIFRAEKIAICGDPNPPTSVQQTAEQLGSIFFQRDRDFTASFDQGSITFNGLLANGESCKIDQLPITNLPFDSVIAAIQVCLLLGLPADSSFYQDLINIDFTGRFQKLTYQSRDIILDVAHNPAAAQHLADKLQQDTCEGKTHAVVAMMADKDVSSIVAPMIDLVGSWYLGDLIENPRALSAFDLQNILVQQGASDTHRSDGVTEAFQLALNAVGDKDRIVVFGSFFTVSAVLDLMANNYTTSPARAN